MQARTFVEYALVGVVVLAIASCESSKEAQMERKMIDIANQAASRANTNSGIALEQKGDLEDQIDVLASRIDDLEAENSNLEYEVRKLKLRLGEP